MSFIQKRKEDLERTIQAMREKSEYKERCDKLKVEEKTTMFLDMEKAMQSKTFTAGPEIGEFTAST